MPRTIYEKNPYNYDVQVPFIASSEVEVPTYELEETTNYRTVPRKVITKNTFTHQHHDAHKDSGSH